MNGIEEIPGAAELVAWFGRFPSFHDAYVVDFRIDGEGGGYLKAKAFSMTDKVDDKGFFILEKHCIVTLHFEEIESVALSDFLPGQAILFGLKIEQQSGKYVVAFDSSYGFSGQLAMRKLTVSHEPLSE